MMRCEPTLILFPGLGVNEKLFEPQRAIPAKIIVPPWPTPQANESLGDYVRRIVAILPPLPEKYWIGGVSFGGIIALEAAKLLKPRGVFVIASYLHWRELSVTARILARATPSIPPGIVTLLLKIAPLLIRVAGRPNRQQRGLLMELLRDSNVPLARWGAGQLADYELTIPPACPIYRIHGTDDRVISFPKHSRVDLAVIGAGHVANVTHPEQVNDFIAKIIGDHIGSSFTV
jgi:pimeloyl-ACP methyl ester carboxylesterase